VSFSSCSPGPLTSIPQFLDGRSSQLEKSKITTWWGQHTKKLTGAYDEAQIKSMQQWFEEGVVPRNLQRAEQLPGQSTVVQLSVFLC